MNAGEKVKEFYNKTPFPGFELKKFNSKKELKITASSFAETLDRSIPENASVIDVGTGTGQLAGLLSLRRKKVMGIDFSENSLNQAKKLKEKLKLNSLELKKIDLLNDKEIEAIGKFDYVLCLGVLQHTANPYKGFTNLLKLLKPKGFIAVGLYNKFGRIPLKIRKVLTKTVFKDNEKIKKHFISMQLDSLKDKKKTEAWWQDQYFHPFESTHFLGEVLDWFKKNKIEFYQTIPSLNFFDEQKLEIAGVWNKYNETKPSFLKRNLIQLSWIWKTQKEGGYWITFGRKK